MRKFAKVATGVGTAIVSFLTSAASVAAQVDYDWEWSTDTTDATGAGLSAAILGGSLICQIIACVFSVAYMAFTIWMLIHAIQQDEKVLPGKIKWILVILLVPFGTLLYFFMRKKKCDAAKNSVAV